MSIPWMSFFANSKKNWSKDYKRWKEIGKSSLKVELDFVHSPLHNTTTSGAFKWKNI